MNRPSLSRYGLPLLLFLALAVIFLGDLWFGGQTLLLRDYFFNDVTTRHYIGKTLAQGKFPTWYPFSQCGVPFSASPYNSAFYPPNWIYALPSVEWALTLSLTLHFALACAGCYALGRYWRFGAAPSVLIAVCFSFSTFAMAWQEFSPGFFCMAWGFFALLLVSRLIDGTAADLLRLKEENRPARPFGLFARRAGTIAALAVVLTLQVLISGELFYYSTLLIAAYGVARWAWHGSWKAAGYSMVWIGVAGGLALGLAAPQLISAFEMLGFSVRSAEVDSLMGMTSEHPRHWLAMLLPYLYGRPGYPATYWAPHLFEFAAGSWYIGIVPLIGVFFAWLRPRAADADPVARERRFQVWFWLAVLVFGLIMAAGKFTPVYGFMHRYFPGMSHLRFPTKFHYYSSLALAILGAAGFQTLIERRNDGSPWVRRIWWIAVGFFGVFLVSYLACLFDNDLLIGLMAHPQKPSVIQVNSAMADYSWAALFAASGISLFGMLVYRKQALKWVPWAIVAVAFVNLCVISRQAQPVGPVGMYSLKPEQLSGLVKEKTMYRYWFPQTNVQQYIYGDPRPDVWAWFAEVGATSHAQELGLSSLTPVGLYLSRYMMLVDGVDKAAPPVQQKLADMISMRYVISASPFDNVVWGNASRDINIVTRPSALPRAFLVSRWQTAEGDDDFIRQLGRESFDPRHEAIVTPDAGTTLPQADESFNDLLPAGKVQSFADHGDALSLEVNAAARALLVVNDTFYPGWSVTVDGIPRPIFRTNFNFRGVFLEPGTHKVEFSFTPTHFALGTAIWGTALLVCGGLFWLSRRNREAQMPVSAKSGKAGRVPKGTKSSTRPARATS